MGSIVILQNKNLIYSSLKNYYIFLFIFLAELIPYVSSFFEFITSKHN